MEVRKECMGGRKEWKEGRKARRKEGSPSSNIREAINRTTSCPKLEGGKGDRGESGQRDKGGKGVREKGERQK